MRATAFAPASIGNVGPGFDVLGLAVDGLGDRVTVELTEDAERVIISGVDASILPTDPASNVSSIAARAMLRMLGRTEKTIVTIEKGLRVAGGLGGSAASSVGGAYAAARAAGVEPSPEQVMAAALAGESAVAGRHLDNIAPCVLGGLALVISTDPIDVVCVTPPEGWHVALVTPDVRVETRAARALLPQEWDRQSWTRQMAMTAGLMHAFAIGDPGLVRRTLLDGYAEPRRAGLIPHFHEVQKAALDAGACGCSISGSGPTVFALAATRELAEIVADAMRGAFRTVSAESRICALAREGVRTL